ncbi:uncharacterized protein V6R79_009801 [Siganus canaliculatus]
MGNLKSVVILVLLGLYSQAFAQTGIQVSIFSSTSRTMNLRWTSVSGASSYKITVALKSSPSSAIAFATFGPNTVLGSVGPLSPNIPYVFTVEALDNSQRVLSTATLESSTAPEIMDPIQTVKPKDSTTLMVEFSPKTGATHYIIRVQNSNGFFREDTVSSSPAEIKSLSPYTEYTLSIMSANSAGRSQPSAAISAKTVLPPPQFSASSSSSNDSITVSWAPVAHAVQYSLSIYKLGSSTNVKHNTSSTSMTVSGLDAGSLYVIRGFAWDLEGRQGEGSVYINQTTRPPSPSSVNVSVVMTNSAAGLSVSWQLDQDVHGSVQFHVTSDQSLTCNSTSRSCTLLPVGCGEVHTVHVTASNEAGPSSPSSPVVFTTFPCPPESLALAESSDGNCTLTWDPAPHADSYAAFIKRSDGREDTCNTTSNSCSYRCQCGYTYLMSVLAFNQAGSSPPGKVLNHTTLPCCPEGVSVSVVSADTLEIMWTASRGAELYETRAVDSSEVILCNDTAPVCALSDLSCDSSYTVVVTPCNEISGCNRACRAHTKDTAPCMPTSLTLSPKNSSCVSVTWTANNRAATYTVSAQGDGGVHTCTTGGSSCDITDLPCGSTYEVSVTAASATGRSLPSYSASVETEPCCPANLTVDQVTQAMTNVSWSPAKGAHSFITSLTSPRGHARCHTQDSHCLMGCITCGTNYTVTMEAYSHSGRKSDCTYQGFSSSACCPSGVRLYRMAGNSLRVYWRSAGSSHSYVAEMVGSSNNYTCTASAGENSCDISSIQCGDVYNVVVAPLTPGGSRVQFCAQRLYSVTCSGSNVGTGHDLSREEKSGLAQGCNILSAKSSGPSSILVKWEKNPSATSYMLDLRVKNNTNIAPVVVTLQSYETERDVQGLRPGTEYSVTLKGFHFYFVACINKDVASTVPDTAQIKSDRALSSTSVFIEWIPVPSADLYILQVQSRATGHTFNVTSTNVSAVVSDLLPATKYDFYVLTANQAGLGSKSKVRTVITLRKPPVNVTATQTGRGSARISWLPVEDVLLYHVVIRDIDEASSPPTVYNISDTQLDVQGILPCSTYLISVSSFNKFLVPSEPTEFTYTTNKLRPVSSVTVDYTCTTHSALVRWSAVFGADSYKATAMGDNGTQLTCTSHDSSCQLVGLACGQSYVVHVTPMSESCTNMMNGTSATFQTGR